MKKIKTEIKTNWKRIVGVLCCLVLFSSVFFYTGGVKNVKAATIGQVLTSPESGWIRYDDIDSRIKYLGTITRTVNRTENVYYRNSCTYLTNINGTISFKFCGSKFRILSVPNTDRTTNYSVTIDNVIVDTGLSMYSNSLSSGTELFYEKTNLAYGIHTVVLTNNVDNTILPLDAIDIDSTGYLIDPSAVITTGISLDKTSLDMNINDTNTITATVSPNNATNKTVKWTSSDSTIATVDDSGKITAVKEGSATITATTSDGSNQSATCIVNVKNPNSGNGLLTVTMTDGQQRTYDLTMAQINDFITWYNNRAGGSGTFTYSFNKTPSSAAYTKRTEYLIYDKISNYDVDQYKTN